LRLEAISRVLASILPGNLLKSKLFKVTKEGVLERDFEDNKIKVVHD
jgi:hypothetical protein